MDYPSESFSFDERARTWDDAKKIERAQKTAAGIRAAVPLSRDMNAFEHGCGTGLLSFELRNELGDITLADTSDGMLEVLREKIAAARTTQMHPVKLDPAIDPLPAERYVYEVNKFFQSNPAMFQMELGQVIQGIAISLKDWEQGGTEN